ncbi:MAG: hypothetical protein ACYDH9_12625 [Limisphaerales bacterium]
MAGLLEPVSALPTGQVWCQRAFRCFGFQGLSRTFQTRALLLDSTGTATRSLADPSFDGDPAFATQEEIDEYRKVNQTEVITAEEPESVESVEAAAGRLADAPLSASTGERDGVRCRFPGDVSEPRKYYFDGGQVETTTELARRFGGLQKLGKP